jgi:uncharacterized protein (TIGR02444 family)
MKAGTPPNPRAPQVLSTVERPGCGIDRHGLTVNDDGNGRDNRALWPFTLDLYARPGVQDAVIALQENQGADVNVLFYCVWSAATSRRSLDAGSFDRVESQIACWRQEVTEPLRRLRARIKADPILLALEGATDARKKVLEAEMESERIAQIAIESTAGQPSDEGSDAPAAIAERNLRAYLRYIDANVNAAAERHLETLLRSAFPR